LLQQLRDEAHRFAVSYYKTLKKNRDFTSEIEDIPGVGSKTVSAVLKYFGSLKNAKKAALSELERVPSVTKKGLKIFIIFFNLRKAVKRRKTRLSESA